MKNSTVENTRSFALIGHTADGKTSLGEALLHVAGATDTLGSTADKTSVLDASPEEQERGHTLSSGLFAFAEGDFHHTLVDTPGDPNFQGDGQITLFGLDGAVLVVSCGGRREGRNRGHVAGQRTRGPPGRGLREPSRLGACRPRRGGGEPQGDRDSRREGRPPDRRG